MLNELQTMVRRYDMLQPGDRVVCALSGGADSVALLFALHLLREKLDIRLEAAHFNHGLRGPESDRDESFVRNLCDRYDIPLHLGRGQVTAGEKGLEAAAREARYGFLETLPGKIATAHTADDNAETVLMRLIRGTGLKGLGGIQPVRGRIIRPMLTVTRRQVLAFLDEYCLSHVEDSSNAGDDFLRNRIRHRILPALAAENPRLSENLSAMALRLRADEEALTYPMDFSRGLSVPEVLGLPEAVGNRVLCAFLEHCGVREPESAHVEQTRQLMLSEKPSAWAAYPGEVTVCRRYDRLVPGEALPKPVPRILDCPGVTELPELGIRVVCAPAAALNPGENTFFVNPKGALRIRFRQPGDCIRLRGGSRSLKKLFIDRKIPALLRDRIPVLADDGGILGIPGIGPDLDRMAKHLPAIEIKIERQRAEDQL